LGAGLRASLCFSSRERRFTRRVLAWQPAMSRRCWLVLLFFLVIFLARAEETAQDLVRAAEKGDVKLVSKALTAGVSVDATNNEGKTALQAAAMRGHAAMVRYLLQAGASVDIQFNQAWSALAFAADYANSDEAAGLETVKALLEAGANPLLEDLHGYNALMRADEGTEHRMLIAARVGELKDTNEATLCVVATGEKCSVKEIAFADKWRGKMEKEMDAEISRLTALLNSTAASSIKPEQRMWLRQRRHVLSQVQGTKRPRSTSIRKAQDEAAPEIGEAVPLKLRSARKAQDEAHQHDFEYEHDTHDRHDRRPHDEL